MHFSLGWKLSFIQLRTKCCGPWSHNKRWILLNLACTTRHREMRYHSKWGNLVGLSQFEAISKFCILHVAVIHEILSLTIHSSCIVNTFSASLPNLIRTRREWNMVDCIWYVASTCGDVFFQIKLLGVAHGSVKFCLFVLLILVKVVKLASTASKFGTKQN